MKSILLIPIYLFCIQSVIAGEAAICPLSLKTATTFLDSNDVITEIDKNICMGDVYEGYDQAGIYTDTFSLESGVDSIRILYLRLINCDSLVIYDLNACSAYMTNGSNMDYTEFVPHFPDISTCAAIDAGYLFRSPPQEHKHSCTPGLNNSSAMCVSALGTCTYLPGNAASVVIEVTLTPDPAATFQLTGIQFFEKAPLMYNWIDGGSGPNNYPTLFGIRILKNGTEIYRSAALPTATSWTLRHFDFTNDTLFEIEEPALFRIELLPYCPVGNGAAIAAWDLEDIVVLGGCLRLSGSDPVIKGKVLTAKGTPVAGVEVHLSGDPAFNLYDLEVVNPSGVFQFDSIDAGHSFFLSGYHNHDFLHGVSTVDLLAIQKHLLGREPFTSLDQYVAGDINHDDKVNISDLIALRKALLGYTSSFAGNTSWRFGVWPQSLEGTDPGTLKEVAYIETLQDSITEVNFLGIKIGDLNGHIFNLTGNEQIVPRRQAFEMRIEDAGLVAGMPFHIDIIATEAIMAEGLQLAWQLDGMTLTGVEGHGFRVSDEHISFMENGLLRLSWVSDYPVHIRQGDVLFSLNFIADKTASLASNIKEANDILSSEIYTPEETIPVKLRHDPYGDTLKEGIGYFTIAPNPFNEEVILRFLVFNDADIIINIYDASGKEVFFREAHYKTGEHFLSVTADDLRYTSGLFFCRIVSGGDSEVRKMVRVE